MKRSYMNPVERGEMTQDEWDAIWKRAWKSSFTVRIITGAVEYRKEINNPGNQRHMPIWKLGCETMNQLKSEQYILSKGFTRVTTPHS